eukprot:403339067
MKRRGPSRFKDPQADDFLQYLFKFHRLSCESLGCPCQETKKNQYLEENDLEVIQQTQDHQQNGLQHQSVMLQFSQSETQSQLNLVNHTLPQNQNIQDQTRSLEYNQIAVQSFALTFKSNLEHHQLLLSKVEQRNKDIIETLFFQFSRTFENALPLKLLEIFVLCCDTNQIYKAMHLLMIYREQIQKCDNLSYYYLKAIILQKAQQIHMKHKQKIPNYIDIDSLLEVQASFQTYKQSVIETAMTVEQFWRIIAQQNYQFEQLQIIGNQLVDRYRQTKHEFEKITKTLPDFEDALVVHQKYLDLVLNFEVETANLNNQLINLRQKKLIQYQSSQNNLLDKYAVIISKVRINQPTQILYINNAFTKLTGYKPQELQDESIQNLIPNDLRFNTSSNQDSYLGLDILNSYQNQRRQSEFESAYQNKRAWLLKKDQSIVAGQIELQMRISNSHDLIIQGIFNPDILVENSSYTYNLKDDYLLITNECGMIISACSKFNQRFIDEDNFSYSDARIFMQDIIYQFNDYCPDDLLSGVKADIKSCISSSEYKTQFEADGYISIILIQNNHWIGKNRLVKEFIIIQRFDTQDAKTYISDSQMNPNSPYYKKDQYLQNQLKGEYNKDEYLNMQLSDQGSVTGSATTSSQVTESLKVKHDLDEGSMPKSLQNLKKAIFIFFLVLLITACVNMGVDQAQLTSFFNDSYIIESSTQVSGNQNYLRLSLRMLVSNSKILDQSKVLMSYDYLQTQMERYFTLLRDVTNICVQEKHYTEQALKNTMLLPNVRINELQDNGKTKLHNETYSIALQTYMAKVQKFITMPHSQLLQEFKSFSQIKLPAKPTQNQKDAYYVLNNGMQDIRSYTLLMNDQFIEQAIKQSNNYQYLIFIITIICIVITAVSSLGVIPITFTLDNESMKVIYKWMLIDQNTKIQTLKRIQEFNQFIDDLESVKKPSNKRKIRKHNHSNNQINKQSNLSFKNNTLNDSHFDQNISLYLTKSFLNNQFKNSDSNYISRVRMISNEENGTSNILQIQNSEYFDTYQSQTQQNQQIGSFQKQDRNNLNDQTNHNLDDSRAGLYLDESLVMSSVQIQGRFHSKAEDIIDQSIQQESNSPYQNLAQRPILNDMYRNINDQLKSNSTPNEKGDIGNGQKIQKGDLFTFIENIEPKKSQSQLQKLRNMQKHSNKEFNFSAQYIEQFQQDRERNSINLKNLNDIQQEEHLQKSNLNDEEWVQNQDHQTQQNKDIGKVFRNQKLKKVGVIAVFCLITIGFYVGLLQISDQISEVAQSSFNYVKTFRRRPTCPPNGINFLLETFAQNKTTKIGFNQQSAFVYLQQTCFKYEQTLNDFQKSKPTLMRDIWDTMRLLDSEKMCEIAFQGNIPLIQECLTIRNGMFRDGLSNAIIQSYYHIVQEYISFEGQSMRTEQFLNQHENLYDTQEFTYIILKFILPASQHLEGLVKKSIKDYLDYLMNMYIVVFVIFAIFILICLIVSLKLVMQIFRRIIIRSKILIKIIPSETLIRIHKELERLKDEKEELEYRSRYKLNEKVLENQEK